MKKGRPTKYTEELGIEICSRIAEGKSLRKICKSDKMPARKTVHLWLLDEDKKEFLHQYEIACNLRAEDKFDELEEIADETPPEETNKARLRIDTRKWWLSKVMPKKYGDKLDMTTDGEPLQVVIPPTVAKSFNINATDKKTKRSNREQE